MLASVRGPFRSCRTEHAIAQVGKGRVICGLSGGVDSSVVAVLLHETIGALFIDVFEAEARKIGGAEFLAQGTLS